MKRRALIGALMLTTAIVTPQEAKAAPVVGFLAGVVNTVSSGVLFAGAVGSAGFAAGATFAASIAGKLILSVGLSFISALLFAPKFSQPPPSERLVNFAQPISYMETMYGRTRKGGPLGFSRFNGAVDAVTGTAGKKRHYSVVLAAHEIEGVVEHYLDERIAKVDGNGLVTTAPMATYYRIRPFLGAPSQTVDAALLSGFAEITAAHDFAGLAGAHLWARRTPDNEFTEVYPTGRQGVYAPVIDGHNQTYDPRDDTRKFTQNAALIMAHWLTEVLGREVHWPDVAIEADASDELVVNGDGGTQPRWTLAGTISDEMSFEGQRAALAIACDAFIYERADGKVGFNVGRYIDPTVTLTASDFFACEVVQGGWGKDAPTEVACKYTEPSNAYRESPSGVIVLDDTTRAVREEPDAFMVTSHNQACRVNKRIGKAKRPEYSLQGTVGLIGYSLMGQRTFRMNNSALGIDAVFEIGKLIRNDDGITFTIYATSTELEDHVLAPEDEPTRPVFNTAQSDDSVSAVTGFAGQAQDGGSILWSWTAQDPSLTQRVRIRKTGETDWQIVTAPSEQNNLLTTGLTDGVSYQGQVQNQTAALRRSIWSPDVPESVTVVANSTPPAPLDAFAAVPSGADADLTFTAPNDGMYYATRIYRGTTTVFANATLIHTEFGIPSNADSYTDANPGADTYQYWAEPINSSGVPGPASGPIEVIVP